MLGRNGGLTDWQYRQTVDTLETLFANAMCEGERGLDGYLSLIRPSHFRSVEAINGGDVYTIENGNLVMRAPRTVADDIMLGFPPSPLRPRVALF